MKTANRVLSMAIILVLVFSIMVIPASAKLNTTMKSIISGFPTLKYNSSLTDYVYALQRFLMCYSTACKNELYYNGHWMDGGYGSGTMSSVKKYQANYFSGSDVDGEVGPKTWPYISDDMTAYSVYDYTNKFTYYDCKIGSSSAASVHRAVPYNDSYVFAYYNEDGSLGSVFYDDCVFG